MNLQMILIIGGILTIIAVIINVAAFFMEKNYKKKMQNYNKKD